MHRVTRRGTSRGRGYEDAFNLECGSTLQSPTLLNFYWKNAQRDNVKLRMLNLRRKFMNRLIPLIGILASITVAAGINIVRNNTYAHRSTADSNPK